MVTGESILRDRVAVLKAGQAERGLQILSLKGTPNYRKGKRLKFLYHSLDRDVRVAAVNGPLTRGFSVALWMGRTIYFSVATQQNLETPVVTPGRVLFSF